MPRMKILDASEQAGFDKPPLFGSEERKRFFDFSATVLEIAERFRTPCQRIGFLLAYGYFRATKKFYSPLDYQPADIAYVAGRLNASPDCFENLLGYYLDYLGGIRAPEVSPGAHPI